MRNKSFFAACALALFGSVVSSAAVPGAHATESCLKVTGRAVEDTAKGAKFVVVKTAEGARKCVKAVVHL